MSKYVCICKLCVSMSSVGYSDVIEREREKRKGAPKGSASRNKSVSRGVSINVWAMHAC